jgi:hypothetical protein
MIAVNRGVMRNSNTMTKITTKIRSTTTILITIDDQDHPLANSEDRRPCLRTDCRRGIQRIALRAA